MSLFPYAHSCCGVTPIVAIAPLIIIWVKDTRAALVLCAVGGRDLSDHLEHRRSGLRSVDLGLLNLFACSRATRWQTPDAAAHSRALLPYFFGGLRIASGLALIGAVVAEFVAGTGGHGAGLALSRSCWPASSSTSRALFAALLLITLTGIAAVRSRRRWRVEAGRFRRLARKRNHRRVDGDRRTIANQRLCRVATNFPIDETHHAGSVDRRGGCVLLH